MSAKCPFCGSVIYSRRNVLCGVCGKQLPHDLLFTQQERELVERDLSLAKRRLRQAIADRQVREAGRGAYGGTVV
jgi:predicted amidophosphoribosyltransferase